MSQRVLLYLPGKKIYINLLQVISFDVQGGSYIIKMTNGKTYTVTVPSNPDAQNGTPYQLLESYLNSYRIGG